MYLIYLDKIVKSHNRKIKTSGYVPGAFIMSVIRDKISDKFGDKHILNYSYYLDTVFSVFF